MSSNPSDVPPRSAGAAEPGRPKPLALKPGRTGSDEGVVNAAIPIRPPDTPGIDLAPGTDRSRVAMPAPSRFQPREPRNWEEAGLDSALVEQILCRYLLLNGTDSGRNIATEVAISVPLVKELLEGMKQQKLVQHRGSTPMGDFIYELTEAGRDRALELRRQCSYVGPAPVPFDQYLGSVKAQSLLHRSPTPQDMAAAFADLVVSPGLIEQLGPAIASGRALFLHGQPGNGKTSIAERVTRCFGDHIWIPHTLLVDGHLIKLYDPATHEMVAPDFRPLTSAERVDRRWIRIKRPTVVAGGELTLDMLDFQLHPQANICEAPLQLKANCGTLVIDDFGRQRIEPQVLLNRWIFPLERRMDFLRLPDGRKVTVPFDPLLVFSTNLDPAQLVDEAFLRRIPYKILVHDPTEAEFRLLLDQGAEQMDVRLPPGSVDHLLTRAYKQGGRAMRFCHPRDLLQQIVHQAAYERRPAIADPPSWDRAITNYFGVL
jgi:hypothetical protein